MCSRPNNKEYIKIMHLLKPLGSANFESSSFFEHRAATFDKKDEITQPDRPDSPGSPLPPFSLSLEA